MILQQLQTYLRSHSPISLEELARQFHTDADALRGMLHPLIRKGRVRQLAGKACTRCHQCSPESLELYEWILEYQDENDCHAQTGRAKHTVC